MTFDDDGPHAGAGALPRVQGAGGGSSSKGSGGAASSAPDTLFSTATVRLVDLLGEGEIVGVRGGLKGIYLNDVPVQNADGSFNFKGLTAEFRVGTPDQPHMAGYPDVQTPNNVGIKVNAATPVTVSISDTDVDRLRVTIQVPSLFLAKSDGSVRANSVSYRIQARYSGGPWVNALGDQTITGKTTSGYFRSHEIALPINPSGASAPWQVQVIRLSPDTDDFNNSQAKFTNQSDLVFHSTTSIVDARFGYPHSALVGLTAQAASFGSSVPGRTYLVDGVLMPIPSNYDPVARTYAGVWDGTFKEGFSNNPAWALNLILRNDRFGLGAFIDTAAIDKWSLYEIGRYCDVRVADGKGGQEPRYVFNGAISTQQEAFELLQLIAQVFRGTVYWSSGTVTAAQDRPADPVLLVTEANVVDGEFSYASSGRRARHTVAIVAWNDPDNLYKQTIEVVEDADGVARYGYNPTKIDLLGCTSRGQAHRTGLWTLFTELHQTQVLAYKAGLDHAVIRPGDIVAVQDPQIANLDLSGRLMGGSTATVLKLDRPVTLTSGSGYAASVMLPDGTVQERAITTGAGTTDTVTLASALSQVPDPAAVWLITGPVAPQLYRIVSIREEEPHIYAVSALQHEPGKYAAIDDGAAFEPSTVSEFPSVVLPPTNLSVRESQYTELGQPKQAMTLSWTAGQPFNSVAYYVTVIRPSGATVTSRTASQSIDFLEAEVGVWTFVVTAIGLNGRPSLPVQTTYTLAGWAGQVATTVTGLSVKGGGSTFSGRSCTVAWANQIAATVPPYPVRNAVYVFDASTSALVHREVLPAGVTEWTYDYFLNSNEGGPRRQFRVGVTAYSAAGDEGPPAYLTVSNPPPAGITPTLTATSETLFVSLPPVTDPDFAGYLVWVSDTPGINPLTAKSYEVTGSLFTFAGTPNKTYYVRAAAFDAFGKNPAELNVSAEQSQTITIKIFDELAPAIPGQPSVSANVAEIAPDGTVTAKITIGWPAVADRNFGTYEVVSAEGSNPAESAYGRSQFVAGTTASFAGLMPGRTYSFKVRANPKNGFADSGWSPVLVVAAAGNTTPPANPADVSLTQSYERVAITFTPPADKDLAFIEVWAAGGTFPQASPIGGSTVLGRIPNGSTGFFDPLAVGGVRTYWLRSVNTSGTPATNYVRAGSATSVQLQAAALANNIIDETKVAAALAVNKIVASLPTTKGTEQVTFGGKVYRWDTTANAYIPIIQASDMAGKITGIQITDGAISTPLLGANVVTAAKINATEIFANAGVFNSLKVGIASFGGLAADQIAAGAITTDKIGVGLNSINLLYGSDFKYAARDTQGSGPWGAGTAGGLAAPSYSGIRRNTHGTNWVPVGLEAYELFWAGAVPDGGLCDLYSNIPRLDGSWNPMLPCVAGQRYEASAYISAHRVRSYVRVTFYDASGNSIVGYDGTVIDASQGNGQLSTFPRSTLITPAAPSNAATVQLVIRILTKGTNNNDPYFFVSGAYLAQAKPNQTTVSDWSIGASTIINGGTVSTGTLHARSITAGTIGTDRLVAGQINVDTIAATGSISADKLNVNVLTAGNITITGGTKLSSWATGTQINGGAIAANSIEAQRLRISTRGITPVNVNFYMDRDANGTPNGWLNWTGGQIEWIDDNGNRAFAGIPAGAVQRGTSGNDNGWATVWWDKTSPNQLFGYSGNFTTQVFANPNCVLVATSFDTTGVTVNWGGVIIDGDKIVANSISARNIAANAIQAKHIAANQITGDKIVGDTIETRHLKAYQITAYQIAGDAVEARCIKAGSVNADKLSVGINNGNMLVNSDFRSGTQNLGAFYFGSTPINFQFFSYPGGVEWGPARSLGCAQAYAGGRPNGGCDIYFNNFNIDGSQNGFYSVIANRRYEASVYLNSWNGTASYVRIVWYDINKNFISDAFGNGIAGGAYNSNMSDSQRSVLFATAPSNAVYAQFVVRINYSGNNDNPDCYITGAYFSMASTYQTAPSPYSSSGQTVIDGGSIRTGSIQADRIAATSLSAIKADLGTVTAGRAQSPDGKFVIALTDKYLAIWD